MIPIREFLPDILLPISYWTYKHGGYVIKGKRIYGATSDNEMIRLEDERGLLKKSSEYFGVSDSNFRHSSNHGIREAYFRNSQNQEKREYHVQNSVEMLLDFLQVAEMIDTNPSKSFSQKEQKGILGLFNKYGMLSWQPERRPITDYLIETTRRRDGTDDIAKGLTGDTMGDESIRFCTLQFTVKKELLEVFALYLIWLELVWEQEGLNRETLHRILRQVWKIPANANVAKRCYQEFVQHMSERNRHIRKIVYMKMCPVISPVYENPFDAVLGTMLSLIEMGQDSRDNKKIAICNQEGCGQYYIQTHGSQKYCEPHRDGTVRVRECRKNKKRKEREAGNGETSKQ